MYFAGGAVYESNWEKGHDQGGQYRFKDGVSLVEDDDLLVGWRYCNPVWDRRFNKVRRIDSCSVFFTGGLDPYTQRSFTLNATLTCS